jgi:hypothetical protein
MVLRRVTLSIHRFVALWRINMVTQNKTDRISNDRRLIAGIQKHLGKGGALFLDGKKYTGAQLVSLLQSRIDATEAIQPAKGAWRKMVKAERDHVAATKPIVDAARKVLLVMFASSVDILSDFGLAPLTRNEPKPETRVKAAQQAKATRAARHTKGRKQKLKIKGQVQATDPVTVSPATSQGGAGASSRTS